MTILLVIILFLLLLLYTLCIEKNSVTTLEQDSLETFEMSSFVEILYRNAINKKKKQYYLNKKIPKKNTKDQNPFVERFREQYLIGVCYKANRELSEKYFPVSLYSLDSSTKWKLTKKYIKNNIQN